MTCFFRLSIGSIQQWALAWMMLGSTWLSGIAVLAAEGDTDYPLVAINVASLQRLRDNAGAMFDSIDRADMSEIVDQWMVTTLKETKGIDRLRPFGMMLYLRPELIGPPLAISYLPVTELDEALQTLAYGAGTISPVDGTTNRHEIRYNESFKLRTLYQNGYLFLVGPDGTDSALDRNFPDPEKMTARLTSQYDVAASFMIKSIPVGLKTVFMTYFKSQSQASLQQRDDEPESVYRLRRANGEIWIEMIDKIINQGNEITIGARMDPEKKVAYIDLEAYGARDSKFAKFFQSIAGKRTYFGNLLPNPATMTVSLSWLLEEKQRNLFVKYFEVAQKDLGVKAEKNDMSGLAKIVEPIFRTLITTAEVGHLDVLAQMTGTEQGEFALVGGVKLATSRNLPVQIEELLQFLQDNPNGTDVLAAMEMSFDAIDSHPVHRLPVSVPQSGAQRMFGENAYLYVYTSPEAIWCAFGSEAALQTLRDSVQSAAQPQDIQQNRNRVPFQFIAHAKNWISVAEDDANPDAVRMTERAKASFESDNDAMTIEVRPTDSGVRIRAEFESGFIAMMGRGITTGIETGAFNPGRGGGRGRGRRGQNEPNQPQPSAVPQN